MIDAIDRKILGLLQGDARLSNADMAEAVGLTVSSVHERVKKMERKGIIKGYVAVVDAEKLGKPLLAYLRLTVSSHDAAKDGIHSLCTIEPDILECHNVAGEDCFILKVRAEGPKQLERLLSAIRKSADSGRSVTNIVLSSYKESTRIEPAPLAEGEQT
jgi:Lrp/AsnC family transcriptional regulator, leucine-responsive regulatory protein